MSAAALSAGMLTIAPAASAEPGTQGYSNIEVKSYVPHGVDCDELLSNFNPRVKHTRRTYEQVAECKKRKHEKR